MQSTKANTKIPAATISSTRIAGAQKKPSAVSSSVELETSNVAPSEVEAKKATPPAKAPLALEGWGLQGYSSSDEEEVKPKPAAAAKKGSKTGGKAASKSKDKHLPAGKKPAQQGQKRGEAEDDDQFMPGPTAAGFDELPSSFNPFADAECGDDESAAAKSGVVHLRMQQRNGKKSLTTVQGLSDAYNYARILRDLKRDLCCNGVVVEDEELGNIIQLQGDHRKTVAAFLVKAGMVTKANVKVHGI